MYRQKFIMGGETGIIYFHNPRDSETLASQKINTILYHLHYLVGATIKYTFYSFFRQLYNKETLLNVVFIENKQ